MRRAIIGLSTLLCLLAWGCDDDAAETPDVAVDPEPEPDMAADPDTGAEPDAGPDPAEAFTALQDAVHPARYRADLQAIASAPRPFPYGENYQATADLCAATFFEAGLQVTRQPLPYGGESIIGVLPGTDRPAEQIIVTANFDSEDHCPGADINASGTAGLLEAARVLGERRYARTIVFACLGAEIFGDHGSNDLVGRLVDAQADVRGMLALQNFAYTDDTPGSQSVPPGLDLVFPAVTGAIEARESRGDFMFYVSDDESGMSAHIEAAGADVDLPVIGLELDGVLRASDLTEALKQSDHRPFWAAGLPGTMFTDTGYLRTPYASCERGDDAFETLDVDFAVKVTRAAVGALARAAEPADGPPAEGRMVEPAPIRPPPLRCDAPSGECDDGQRCALLSPSGLTCEPAAADPLGLDAPCERREDGGDSCDAGLFCSFAGFTLEQGRRCRPLCQTSADCGPSEVCPDLGLEASNCVARCDPFGDDCGPGTGCVHDTDLARIGNIFFCGLAGDVAEGEACDEARCVAGTRCTSEYGDDGRVCRRYCRPSAPDCGADLVCVQLHGNGVPADTGLCAPAAYRVD